MMTMLVLRSNNRVDPSIGIIDNINRTSAIDFIKAAVTRGFIVRILRPNFLAIFNNDSLCLCVCVQSCRDDRSISRTIYTYMNVYMYIYIHDQIGNPEQLGPRIVRVASPTINNIRRWGNFAPRYNDIYIYI